MSQKKLAAQQDTVKLPVIQVFGRKIIKQTGKKDFSSTTYYLQKDDVRINVRDYGGVAAQVSLRGFKASHTKLVLLGVPVALGGFGGYDYFLAPVELFDNINIKPQSEILKVAGALGGFIGMDVGNRCYDSVCYSLNINSLIGMGAKLVFSRSLGRTSVMVRSFSQISENNYKYVSPYSNAVQTERRTSFGKSGTLASVSYDFSRRVKVSANFLQFDVVRSFPPPVSYQGPERREIEHFRQDLSVIAMDVHVDRFFINVKAGVMQQFSDYGLKMLDSSWVWIISSDWHANTYFTRANVSYPMGRASVEWRQQDYVAGASLPVQKVLKAVRNDFSIVLRHRLLSVGKYRFFTTQRLEYIDDKLFYLYDFSLRLRSSPDVKLSFTKNINYPSLNDLYWIPGGNRNLLPEISHELNLSVRTSFLTGEIPVFLKGEFFAANIRNWIQWKPSQYHYWVAQNLPCVRNRTAIFEFSYYIKHNFFDNFRLSYQFASVTDSTGQQIIYVPRHKLLTTLGINIFNTQIELTGVYESRRYVLQGNRDYYLDPYMLWFMGLRRNLDLGKAKVDIWLQVNNLLNERYMLVIGRPQPLRNCSLTIKIKL